MEFSAGFYPFGFPVFFYADTDTKESLRAYFLKMVVGLYKDAKITTDDILLGNVSMDTGGYYNGKQIYAVLYRLSTTQHILVYTTADLSEIDGSYMVVGLGEVENLIDIESL